MQVETYLFGTIDVDPSSIISFPAGLPAFENCTRFKLVHEELGDGSPASYTLQSLDNPTLAIQIIDPASLGFNYELALSPEEMRSLQAASPDEIAIMLAIYKKPGSTEIGANVRAPILINPNSRIAMQKVMHDLHTNVTLSNLSSAVSST